MSRRLLRQVLYVQVSRALNVFEFAKRVKVKHTIIATSSDSEAVAVKFDFTLTPNRLANTDWIEYCFETQQFTHAFANITMVEKINERDKCHAFTCW